MKVQKLETYPRNIMEQAEMVLNGWEKMKDKMVFPVFTLGEMKEKIELAKDRIKIAEKYKLQQKTAIGQRDSFLTELWDMTKRVRNAAKSALGDNSEEIKLFKKETIRFRKANKNV